MPAETDARADAARIAPARIGAALGAALAAQDALGVRALGMLRDARCFLTEPQGLEYPAAHAVASCRMAIDFLLQLSKMTTGPGLLSAARAVLGDVDALLASADPESDAYDPTSAALEKLRLAREDLAGELGVPGGFHNRRAQKIVEAALGLALTPAGETALRVWSDLYKRASGTVHGSSVTDEVATALFNELVRATEQVFLPRPERADRVVALAQLSDPTAADADEVASWSDPIATRYFLAAAISPTWLTFLPETLLLPYAETWDARPYLDKVGVGKGGGRLEQDAVLVGRVVQEHPGPCVGVCAVLSAQRDALPGDRAQRVDAERIRRRPVEFGDVRAGGMVGHVRHQGGVDARGPGGSCPIPCVDCEEAERAHQLVDDFARFGELRAFTVVAPGVEGAQGQGDRGATVTVELRAHGVVPRGFGHAQSARPHGRTSEHAVSLAEVELCDEELFPVEGEPRRVDDHVPGILGDDSDDRVRRRADGQGVDELLLDVDQAPVAFDGSGVPGGGDVRLREPFRLAHAAARIAQGVLGRPGRRSGHRVRSVRAARHHQQQEPPPRTLGVGDPKRLVAHRRRRVAGDHPANVPQVGVVQIHVEHLARTLPVSAIPRTTTPPARLAKEATSLAGSSRPLSSAV
ncbi:hypothetical protein [Streptomyces sp. SID3343]|uniref:hypothetical protein n=1 Tax=Streptomyces sp. SID3343 TaxID=2690260 RepID=UPI00136A0841|nr:hypothetical protein [Streptomyces sp. SID3343]MYV98096.1 hypothetical protein [Streptomyces sp. SID3343]